MKQFKNSVLTVVCCFGRLQNEEFFPQVVVEEFTLEVGVCHVAEVGEAEAGVEEEEEVSLCMPWLITAPEHLKYLLLQKMTEKISFLILRYVEVSFFFWFQLGFLEWWHSNPLPQND